MSSLRLLINRRHYCIALMVIGTALLLKSVYLWGITSYQNSLSSGDTQEYWYDSLQLAFGDHRYLSQWGGFAPFYKYFFLVPFFRFLSVLGVLSYGLSLTIFTNVLLYGISSYFFYLIVDRLITDKAVALTALISYAFSYLAFYTNAMVLPDSLAISLTVIATGIIILTVNCMTVFIAGSLLGIAIAAKPFLFVFCPAFIWYIFSKSCQAGRAWKAGIFMIALTIVPMMTVMENYRISDGKLLSLAAIGGSNFFQGWGKVGLLTSTSQEGPDTRYSPGALDERTWKAVTVKEPWYHQGYFYHLGIKSIADDPCVVFEKISWFGKFFWGRFGPCLKYDPAGYKLIMPVIGNISYLIFLSIGLLWLFFRGHEDTRTVRFLAILLASFFIAIYLIGLPERRYYLNVEFLVTALFFIMVNRISVLYRVYRNEIWAYAFFVFSFFICVPAAWMQLSKIF